MAFPAYSTDCLQGVYETRFTVTDAMTDTSGRMRLGDLARQMEKATAGQLSAYSMSREELQQEGKIWVIAWTSIEITKLPREQTEVILRVWPGKNKSMMYTRRYAFYTTEEEPLVCAASLFLLMDQETRSAAAPTEKLKAVPVITLEGEPKLPKLRMDFPEQFSHWRERVVAAEEIDKNGHLNNTRYLDWAEELFGESGQEEMFRSVWVQYRRELREGQKVELRYEDADGVWYLQGSAEGAVSFLVKMER